MPEARIFFLPEKIYKFEIRPDGRTTSHIEDVGALGEKGLEWNTKATLRTTTETLSEKIKNKSIDCRILVGNKKVVNFSISKMPCFHEYFIDCCQLSALNHITETFFSEPYA